MNKYLKTEQTIKECCNNIISIVKELKTADKGEINDLLISLDLNRAELNKQLDKL